MTSFTADWVAGGRDFDDYAALAEFLDNLDPPVLAVVHGGAVGADQLGGRYARERGLPEIVVAAYRQLWEREGKRAGPRRNAWIPMYVRVGRLCVTRGGRGTASAITVATRAKIPVVSIEDQQ